MATPTPTRRGVPRAALFLVLLAIAAAAGPRAAPARAQDPTPPPPEPTAAPTRRATRTPRATALPTATPLPAGALRVALGPEPAAPSVGESVDWVVSVENLAPGASGEILLELSLPAVLVLEDLEPTEGQTAREGRAVRWFVPNLAAGATAVLRARGVAGRATAPLDPDHGCAVLLSRGAPVEFCARFDAGELRAGADRPVAPDAPAFPTAPTGIGLADAIPPPRAGIGLVTLVVGFGALGAWLGSALRGTIARPTAPAADAGDRTHERGGT